MDEMMLGAEEQEVAAPAMTEQIEPEEAEMPTAEAEAEGAEEQEVAEPAAEAEGVREEKRTADQSFAQMRRRAQDAEERVQKMEESQRRLLSALGNLGFHGSDLDEVTDRAVAHYTGKPVEEVKNSRLLQERERQQAQEQMRQTEALKEQNRALTMQLVKNRMAEDLAEIQRIDPKVKSLNELGPEFGQLIRQGIPAARAYRVLAEEKKAAELTPPVKIGKVNAKTKAEKDFYTSEEVDRLTEKDLEDPKVRAKVMKSMTRW